MFGYVDICLHKDSNLGAPTKLPNLLPLESCHNGLFGVST